MIHYSSHSENFGKFPAEDTFAYISRLGFLGIDVAARSLAPQAAVLANPEREAAVLKALSEKYNLKLWELFFGSVELNGSSIEMSADNRAIKDDISRNFDTICRFTRLAGFNSIMTSAGSENASIGFDKSFENAAEMHRLLMKIANDNGVKYHVEPSRTSLLNTPEQALKMTEAAPGLKYTLDFLHYQISATPQKESMKLIPHAGHMHARQAKTGVGKSFYHEGEIDFDEVVKGLYENKWEGCICMEFWNDPPLEALGIDALEQNMLMKYELRRLVKKYYGVMTR